MAAFVQDLRYGLRMLARNPGFTAVAVFSLALGIGPNTTIFSLINAVFLSEVTAVEPERLMHIDVGKANQVSYPNYRDLAESKALAGLAGYSHIEMNWQRGEAPERAASYLVTANFFEVLGVQAKMGRVFTAEEARPERNPQLAVLSHGFWQRRLGGTPSILDSVLTLNDQRYTVVGILPPAYRAVGEYGTAPDLYLPLSSLSFSELNNRSQICVELVGRLAAGVTRQQARAALTAVAQRLEQAHPRENEGFGKVRRMFGLSRVERLQQVSSNAGVLFAGLLAIVVGLVLLIACANVAGLLLARATTRRREIAVRLALGASRRRLLQQLLTESFLLAFLGAAFGLLLNLWLADLINRVQLPSFASFELHLAPNVRLLLYSMIVTAGATVLCGLMPALAATRPELLSALKQAEPRFAHRRFTLRSVLVVGQVAVSLVLLVAASLFLRSLGTLAKADPGFNVANTLSVRVNHVGDSNAGAFYEQAMGRLQAIPGVVAASCAAIVPLSFSSAGDQVEIEGRTQGGPIGVGVNAVGPRFFETIGIPLLRGREFQIADREGAPRVAIINETFAKHYFPNQDPVGKRLFDRLNNERGVLEIVGVVRDHKYRASDQSIPFVYRSHKQPPWIRKYLTLVVRTAGAPNAVRAGVQQAVHELDPSASVDIRTFEDVAAFSLFPGRLAAVLLTGLGSLGLLLAVVGLYGVMAYAVSRRTPEFGIRVALGATRTHLLRMVLGEGLVLVSLGAAIGLVLSLILNQPLATFLAPGIGSTDPVSLAVVTLVFALVGIGACLVPARRAAKVDPIVALRHE